MRILGFDPGLATVGYGVIESDGRNNVAVDYGVIRTPPNENTAVRLADRRGCRGAYGKIQTGRRRNRGAFFQHQHNYRHTRGGSARECY